MGSPPSEPHQRLTLLRTGFAVIDDFLEPSDFAFVHHGLKGLGYRQVGSDFLPVGAAWSPEEPRPLESRVFSSELSRDVAEPANVALSVFIAALKRAANLVAEVCALSAADVSRFSLKSYLYPQSVSLNWHSDAGKGGAFTFYHHERWHRRWGGELLVADRDATSTLSVDTSEPSEDDDGYFLRPLPNRLVVVRGGIAHKIAPVSRAAGGRCRSSLTGFFTPNDGDD